MITRMDDLEQKLLRAKDDEFVLAELIESERQWILRCASKSVGKYVTDSDDEWSVALMAFSESVQSYDPEKGGFRSLASLIIKRRLTDHMRSEGRHMGEISVAPGVFSDSIKEDEADGISYSVRSQIAKASAGAANDDAERAREEISAMQTILAEYGFSFFDLAESSPKAEKTKKSCARAICTLIASAILMAAMRLKRRLPIKQLSDASGVVRKILDRHRKYIIASAEILDGDFPILASYLSYIRRECEQ